MRIVAGALRGRPIVAPKGHSTRPTADRVRQAIFDILEHAPFSPPLAGARVADLFAGSGAMGLEALSRGAASCLFVETDAAARAAIGRNLEGLGLTDRGRVQGLDARRLGEGSAFDLVFLDPPYGTDLAEPALASLLTAARMPPDALAILERSAGEPPLFVPGFTVLAERRWGRARVWFLRAGTKRTGRP
jgi:16S rRNA (guanine966-N2)-methyltransferase